MSIGIVFHELSDHLRVSVGQRSSSNKKHIGSEIMGSDINIDTYFG
jgi:hypothetical protein